MKPILYSTLPLLLFVQAHAAPPLLVVSFEDIERDGRYVEGSVAQQPATERSGEPTPAGRRWLPFGIGGEAVVAAESGVPAGGRVLAFSGAAALERNFPGHESGIRWVEGWHRGSGGELALAEADYPTAEDGIPAAALVHFSASNGIELLDGDGSGGGTPVVAQRPAWRGAGGTWTRVTMRIDYGAREWVCYLDGQRAHEGSLGFRDNSATPTGLHLRAGTGEAADALRVLVPVPGDANTDGVVDAADVVAARRYLSYDPATYDIIGVGNVSVEGAVDGEGRPIVTEEDIEHLRGMILGTH